MSIPKLIVTPLKYFHYVDNEIFINYLITHLDKIITIPKQKYNKIKKYNED